MNHLQYNHQKREITHSVTDWDHGLTIITPAEARKIFNSGPCAIDQAFARLQDHDYDMESVDRYYRNVSQHPGSVVMDWS